MDKNLKIDPAKTKSREVIVKFAYYNFRHKSFRKQAKIKR